MPVHLTCPKCGAAFSVNLFRAQQQGRRFCSSQCWYSYNTVPPTERFLASFKEGPGCWEWTALRSTRGYGVLGIPDPARPGRTRRIHAHRYAWELKNGPIPSGMFICHRCDNPPCVRPDHLFLGTALDNVADMVSKGRRATTSARGVRNVHSKLTDQLVIQLRQSRASGVKVKELAHEFGITEAMVTRITTRRAWQHVP